MSRGDSIQVTMDLGGTSRVFEVTTRVAGRTVEVRPGTLKGTLDVVEVKGFGSDEVVRRSTFMAARIIALIEHKAEVDDSQVQERLMPI